ncbi:hypothetical protein HanPI659440_Chr16g0625681 [Helianthus annuus]|nr:hypothetical protein HanPI659440_Chr16g0625681 [Helianthus annuus]
MKKYVFGLGSGQVLVTAIVVGLVAYIVCGLPGPAAIVIGNGLALSSTAVVVHVLAALGTEYFENLLPDIIRNCSHPNASVCDGKYHFLLTF